MAKCTGNPTMKKNAVFIYSKEQLGYSFSDSHPFNQKRIVLTLDLLKSSGAITDSDIIAPRIATDEELLLHMMQSLSIS